MGTSEAIRGIQLSLPANDPELARAARDAGVHGLKVHVGLIHRASGTVFGTLEQEAERLEEILSLGLPTGLVPGSGTVDLATIRAAQSMGFAYIDLYRHELPRGYVEACGAAVPMAALGPDDGPGDASDLVASDLVALELSTLDRTNYGTPLSPATVERLRGVAEAVEVPVVVPTQHHIEPEELGLLLDAGASALLLGAVVTGTETAGLVTVVESFVASFAAHGAA